MQTFRISKVQEQSYYAIRIFGIVHLIAAVGLVVLLDGPGNGLRGISWFLILVFLSSSGYLLVRILQARAGRIHGHYVLTRNTLAIVLPGQSRKFCLRNECKVFLPHRDEFLLRDLRRVSLRSPSAKPYQRDLTLRLCQAWWPAFHGTPLWTSIQESQPGGSLELRVDFYGRPDGRDPLLVYSAGRWYYARHVAGMLAGCLVLSFFLSLAYLSWVDAKESYAPALSLVRYIAPGAAGVLGASATLTALVYVTKQVFGQGSLKHALVISKRGLAVLRAGKQPAFYRSEALKYFNMATGRLFFDDGSNVIVAPYLYGGPYGGLLRSLFARWRPGGAILPLEAFGMSTLFNIMSLWTLGCLCLGVVGSMPLGPDLSGAGGADAVTTLVVYGILYPILGFRWWHGLRNELREKTDLSINVAQDSAIPDVAGGEPRPDGVPNSPA